MASHGPCVAVLFAVICDSARLYETLGDDQAHRRIADCAQAMAAAVLAQGGRVVKTVDAEMLAVLPDADCAFRAAAEMKDAQASGQLPIRVGFHIGPVIEEAGDVFGDTVNLSARVMALAHAGETLFTDAAARALSSEYRSGTRLVDREVTVKGKSAPISVHELVVRDQDMTTMALTPSAQRVSRVRLGLDFQGRRLVVGGSVERVTIGRVDMNDLVIPDTAVSRLHATIQERRGHFQITDSSTNGTYVQIDGRAPLLLKRDTVQLAGTGSLSLGRPPSLNADNLIWFELIER